MTEFANEKRATRSLTEYPGTVTWYDHEIKCPCGNWTDQYGDWSTEIDGKQFWICPACVKRDEHV